MKPAWSCSNELTMPGLAHHLCLVRGYRLCFASKWLLGEVHSRFCWCPWLAVSKSVLGVGGGKHQLMPNECNNRSKDSFRKKLFLTRTSQRKKQKAVCTVKLLAKKNRFRSNIPLRSFGNLELKKEKGVLFIFVRKVFIEMFSSHLFSGQKFRNSFLLAHVL